MPSKLALPTQLMINLFENMLKNVKDFVSVKKGIELNFTKFQIKKTYQYFQSHHCCISWLLLLPQQTFYFSIIPSSRITNV